MDAEVAYVPWKEKQEVNELAQHASKYKELQVEELEYDWLNMVVQDTTTTNKDWRHELIDYLEQLLAKQASHSNTLLGVDLYRRMANDLLLKCASTNGIPETITAD